MKNKKYKFGIFYDRETGKGVGIRFKDGSRIVFDKKRMTLRFALPRKKFTKPFKTQEKAGWKDYEFELNNIEINAMLSAFKWKIKSPQKQEIK